jgi:hypothetical protein
VRFDPVHPNDLHKVWGWVSDGIWEVIELCKERFRPEDIYCALKRNSAWLYVFPPGFIVLEILTDPNNGERALNAWVMHFKGQLDANRKDVVDFLDDTARKNGCTTIRFGSPRGWGRFLHGEFKEKMVIYERVV